MTALTYGLLIVGLQAAPPAKVTTADLAKHDKKTVTLIGKVEKYEEKTSKSSKKPYTVFVLADAKGKVNVYLQGRPEAKIKDGSSVKVTGLYQKEKQVKKLTFKNEIDCSVSLDKSYGVKPAK